MAERPRLERKADLKRGQCCLLACQLALAGGCRRSAQHLAQMIRARPGGAVEQLLGVPPGDSGRMTCPHLTTFSAKSRLFVTLLLAPLTSLRVPHHRGTTGEPSSIRPGASGAIRMPNQVLPPHDLRRARVRMGSFALAMVAGS